MKRSLAELLDCTSLYLKSSLLTIEPICFEMRANSGACSNGKRTAPTPKPEPSVDCGRLLVPVSSKTAMYFFIFLGEGLTCNYLIIVRDCHQQKQRPDYESKSNEDKQLKISWRVDRRSAASAAMYGCSRPSTSESQFLDLFENAQYKSETFTTWEDD